MNNSNGIRLVVALLALAAFLLAFPGLRVWAQETGAANPLTGDELVVMVNETVTVGELVDRLNGWANTYTSRTGRHMVDVWNFRPGDTLPYGAIIWTAFDPNDRPLNLVDIRTESGSYGVFYVEHSTIATSEGRAAMLDRLLDLCGRLGIACPP